MSDQNVTTDASESIAPVAPEVVAQESKTVGDEAVAAAEGRGVQVEVQKDEVAAQVAQPRESDPATVAVHEVSVQTDEVITDPSSPLAVQVPDAGRGTLDLPIHRLNEPTVEERFKDAE